MQEPFTDLKDYKTLLLAILRQAIDDYIKLQHPKCRKKKYLTEAFQNAIDMFFDSDYKMLYLRNDDGVDMSVQDMLALLLKRETPDITKLRDYLVKEVMTFWDTKEINVIEIPETLQINGHVYHIYHTDKTPKINFKNKTIKIDKDSDKTENQEQFMHQVVEIMLHHEEISLSKEHLKQLSSTWFRTLKLNNCFLPID